VLSALNLGMLVPFWVATGEGNEITKEVVGRRSGDGRPSPDLHGGSAGGGAVKVAWLSLPSVRSVTAPLSGVVLAAVSGEGVAWSGRRCCGGPELGGASGGGDVGAGRAAGELECAERLLDLVGWPVVLEDVADLAAGQSCRVMLEGGVDLLGERVACGACWRPGGAAGCVVPERERGLEVTVLMFRSPWASA
jgi:hypothetical protein